MTIATMTILTATTRGLALAQLERKLDQLEQLEQTFNALAGAPTPLTPIERLGHVEGLVRLARSHTLRNEATGPILIAAAAQIIRWLEAESS